MEYKDLVHVYSEDGLQHFFTQCNQRHYLWHIALPKSGSSWLSKIMTSLYYNEGWEVSKLLPAYDRRHQEIDPRYFFLKGAYNSKVFFVHQHCVYSNYTEHLIRQSGTKCILQVRNLFDVVVSIFDHFKSLFESNNAEKNVLPSGYETWTDETLMSYIIDIEIPWYLKFIEGWYNSPLMKENKLILVSYEAMIFDAERCVKNIVKNAGLTTKNSNIKLIIDNISGDQTRLNSGSSGRGAKVLTNDQIDKILTMAAYFNLDKDFPLLSV